MRPSQRWIVASLSLTSAAALGAEPVTALLDAAVEDERGNEVGRIKDLFIEGNEIVAVEIATGATVEFDGEPVEVPFDALRIDAADKVTVARSQLLLLASAAAGQAGVDAPPAAGRDVADGARALDPLDVDEELAEIDPRLAEGIEASEEAYDVDLDEESFDTDHGGAEEATR